MSKGYGYTVEGIVGLHNPKGFCDYFVPWITDLGSFAVEKDGEQVTVEIPRKRVRVLFEGKLGYKVFILESHLEVELRLVQGDPFRIFSVANHLNLFLHDQLSLRELNRMYGGY